MGQDTSHTQKSWNGSDSVTITVILYKGSAVMTLTSEVYENVTVTGNAQKVTSQYGYGYIQITGDASIGYSHT